MQNFFVRRLAQGVARCLAVAVLAVAGVSGSASPAHALSVTTCTGTSAINYSPGLKNTPQNLSYTLADTHSSCTSTVTGLTSGSSSANVTLEGASCTGAGIFPSASYTIAWNNSQSSTATLTVTDTTVGGNDVATGVGTVTSGLFTGGVVAVTWVYPSLNLQQCSTSEGITSQSGTVTVQIVVLP